MNFARFALSPSALWSGNFRDLNAAIVRMGTLAQGARISGEIVQKEIQQLKVSRPFQSRLGPDHKITRTGCLDSRCRLSELCVLPEVMPQPRYSKLYRHKSVVFQSTVFANLVAVLH